MDCNNYSLRSIRDPELNDTQAVEFQTQLDYFQHQEFLTDLDSLNTQLSKLERIKPQQRRGYEPYRGRTQGETLLITINQKVSSSTTVPDSNCNTPANLTTPTVSSYETQPISTQAPPKIRIRRDLYVPFPECGCPVNQQPNHQCGIVREAIKRIRMELEPTSDDNSDEDIQVLPPPPPPVQRLRMELEPTSNDNPDDDIQVLPPPPPREIPTKTLE